MAGLGTTAALTGLSKSVDYVGQNQREFAQMQNIETDLAKTEQANLMAQELEAKQYAEISAAAKNMLAPDRVKIQQKSLELQKTIRAKIEEYGSRREFLKNGGVALIEKYKSGVLNSPETLGYIDNQKNMEQLMKIQADGKGHLISDRDKQSLDNYNAGVGDGTITYSGMKSDVVIPEKYYNYGEEVPTEAILRSNYMQIYNNWLLDNPDMQALDGEALQNELRQYTFKNHYGQGINMQKYQNDLANENLRKQQRAIESSGTGKENEEPEASYTAAVNTVFNQMQESSPTTINDLMNPENIMKRQATKNSDLSGILGRVNEYAPADSNYVDTDFSFGINTLKRTVGLDEKYTPASAVLVPAKPTKVFFENYYPGSPESGGVNAPINSQNFYSPNGNKLPDDTVRDIIKDGLNQNMGFEGLIYAFVDDKNNMVTQVKDRNGKPLGKVDKSGTYQLSNEEQKHRDMFSGKMRNEMFAVLTTKDGDKIYHRLDVNSMKGESDLGKMFGDFDNVGDAIKRRQKTNVLKANNEVQKKWNAKVIQTNVAAASQEGQIFATPEFKADASLTKVADGSNRYALTKAYYMALNDVLNEGDVTPESMTANGYYKRNNQNNFSNRINYSPELKDALVNKNKISDEDFINLMAKVTAGGNEEDYAHNQILSNSWLKFYKLLKK